MVEVTRRCDLRCPVCFASAGEGEDPPFERIAGIFKKIAARAPGSIVQISGGEPAMRDDLPELIAEAAGMNFAGVQLNTNGLRLASEPGFARTLKEHGLSWVYLQFDGTDDAVYERLRGRPLFDLKRRAVERCAEAQLGVVLVATVRRGTNDHLLGDIIRFGTAHAPTVRGVHFQPMAFFGRYPEAPKDNDRTTLADVLRSVCEQHGFFRTEDFSPCGGLHPLCAFTGEFLVSGGELARKETERVHEELDLVRATSRVASRWTLPSPSGGGAEDGFEKILSWRRRIFTITAMAFQDAWTIDTERLQRCPIKYVAHDGRFFPFCAYNATSTDGRSLYRKDA